MRTATRRLIWLPCFLFSVACGDTKGETTSNADAEQTTSGPNPTSSPSNVASPSATNPFSSEPSSTLAGSGGAAIVPAMPTSNEPVNIPNGEGGAPTPTAQGGSPAIDEMPSGGGGAGGTPAPDSEPGVAPTISELSVVPNPNNVISCFVSWKTDVAASSEVQFGVGGYELRIADEAQVTEHRVVVIGLRPESDYMLRAVSTNSGGAAMAEGTFSSGTLPDAVAVPELTTRDVAASEPGWTLTNLMAGGSGFSSQSPAVAVIYDHEGNPVWYYINGDSPDSRGDISVDYLSNGNILIGPAPGEPPREVTLGGEIVWQGPEQPNGGEIMSHHAGKLDNGNYIILRDHHSPEYDLTGALIEEVDVNNTVVWSWNIFDHVQPEAGAETDWCHANSVSVFLEEDVFYLSCRWLGVFKARRSDGELLWTLGEQLGGDFAFAPATSGFADQHDPELQADGSMLLYDNGGYDQLGGQGDFRSRVVQYALDETTMEATLLWEFPGDFAVDAWYTNDWYTPFWGDADRLANGNVLVTAGVRGQEQTRLFEVRPSDGAVVWELRLPPNNGSYRAQRIPALAEPL